MTIRVSHIREFDELKPKFVKVGQKDIAIYKHKNHFFAYANECPHQDGPVCEGMVWADQVCVLGPRKTVTNRYNSTDKYNIICPWHGLEFDLETGTARGTIDGDNKLKLKRINILIEDDTVVIRV